MHVRAARQADSADLAILDDVASAGLASAVLEAYVREGLADRPLEFARDGFAFVESPFHWSNAIVAEIDGGVAGALISWPMEADDGEASPDDPVLAPIGELKQLAPHTRFIDSLAVYTRFRGQGVASALLAAEFARADRPSSLITHDSNAKALALYRANGFAVVAHRPYVAFNDRIVANEWLLLVREKT